MVIQLGPDMPKTIFVCQMGVCHMSQGSWTAIKVGKNNLVWCFYEMIESLFAIGDTMFLSWLRMIVKFIISRRPIIFVKFASLVLDFIFFLLVLHIFWHLMDLAYPQFPVTFLSSLMFSSSAYCFSFSKYKTMERQKCPLLKMTPEVPSISKAKYPLIFSTSPSISQTLSPSHLSSLSLTLTVLVSILWFLSA